MKLMKVIFATAIALTFTSAYAFHSGGVAECEGCHSMHTPAAGGSYLLVGSDQSSACLTCHASEDTVATGYHIASLNQPTPTERTPGGDFSWVKKSYTYTSGTTTYTERGEVHGHNIIAADFQFVADARPANASSPGGSFPGASLACNSCHDPHGKFRRMTDGTIATTGAPIKASGSYPGAGAEPAADGAVGVYRLLAGSGYQTKALGVIGFPGVPAAKAPSTYNQGEGTAQVRVAYGVGTTAGHTTWGSWCGTCHPGMHSGSGTNTNYTHPIDKNLGVIAALYNSYVKSGDLTGTQLTAFSSLTPFTEGTGDYTVLASHASNTLATSGGPAETDQVNCMSCHRAHASGFAEMLRFDYGYEFTTKASNYVGSDNPAVTGGRAPLQHRGRTMAEWQKAFYDRPATQFATYQRVLCNKCHAKD